MELIPWRETVHRAEELRPALAVCDAAAVVLPPELLGQVLLLSGTRFLWPPKAVCFVLGSHDHFPVVSVSQFYTEVFDACYSYGSVSAVAVSGSSQVAANYDITPPSVRVDTDKRRQLAEGNTATVLRALQTVSADAPEVDTLGAITLGRDLLVKKNAAQKSLVIVDSMLSTTSLLDFSTASLIEQSPEEIVAQLEQRGFIRRVKRYQNRPNGSVRQTSNAYYIQDAPPLPISRGARCERMWKSPWDWVQKGLKNRPQPVRHFFAQFLGKAEVRFYSGIKAGGRFAPTRRETPPRNAGRGFDVGGRFSAFWLW